MSATLTHNRRTPLAFIGRWLPAALVIGPAALLVIAEPSDLLAAATTIFLGILFEALPFLLLGVLVSAGVQCWIPARTFQRWAPVGRLRGALTGALFGAVFPVCECGVVPLTRRLLAKGAGLPLSLGLLLAGPVVNPVVLLATWTALGLEFAVARLLWSLGVAIGVAWLYGFHPEPASLLRAPPITFGADPDHNDTGAGPRWIRALVTAGQELREMAGFLIVGAALAAALRTLAPGSALVTLGDGPVISVMLMMLLAALLSICSAVDAFVALSFSGTVSSGALLAFLVFGPVVDIKSLILYGAVFRVRTVLTLAILIAQIVFLAGVVVNLHIG